MTTIFSEQLIAQTMQIFLFSTRLGLGIGSRMEMKGVIEIQDRSEVFHQPTISSSGNRDKREGWETFYKA